MVQRISSQNKTGNCRYCREGLMKIEEQFNVCSYCGFKLCHMCDSEADEINCFGSCGFGGWLCEFYYPMRFKSVGNDRFEYDNSMLICIIGTLLLIVFGAVIAVLYPIVKIC